MGRLDIPDVYRDEDYTFDGSSVDSPCMAREAGDSIVLRATEESRCDRHGTVVWPLGGCVCCAMEARR